MQLVRRVREVGPKCVVVVVAAVVILVVVVAAVVILVVAAVVILVVAAVEVIVEAVEVIVEAVEVIVEAVEVGAVSGCWFVKIDMIIMIHEEPIENAHHALRGQSNLLRSVPPLFILRPPQNLHRQL
jgi:hypothetical protein